MSLIKWNEGLKNTLNKVFSLYEWVELIEQSPLMMSGIIIEDGEVTGIELE